MTIKKTARFRLGISASLALLLPAASSHAFVAYIDHPSNYSSGDCHYANNDGCGDVTGSIRSGLTSLGWTVNYWTSSNAWATDFMESTESGGGEDASYADAAQLAIFDGHGNTGQFGFAYSHNGVCWTPRERTELSRLGGAQAAVFISTACCYMHMGFPETFTQHSGLGQQLGFGGEASMDSGMMSNYYNASNTNNAQWLWELEDKPGWFTGDNTTVIFTRGNNPSSVDWNYNNCGLKKQYCVSAANFNVNSYWRYDWIDHGTSGCNATPPTWP
jgi:hypothetical protein